MVSQSPKGLFPFQMAELHGFSMGVTNYLLTGMMLQGGSVEFKKVGPFCRYGAPHKWP